MIALTTWATPGFRDGCCSICITSIRSYVMQHDATARFVAPSSPVEFRHPSWRRLPIMRHLINSEYDWLVWLDADGVIVPHALDLDYWLSNVPEAVNVVTGHDWNGICNAFIAVRCCPWSDDFLRAMHFIGTFADVGMGNEFEQSLFKSFFMRAREHQHRLLLAPSAIFADISLSSKDCQFYYHVGGGNTVDTQQAVLAGQATTGMQHGVRY